MEDLTKRTLSSLVEQRLVLKYQTKLINGDLPYVDSGETRRTLLANKKNYQKKIREIGAEFARREVLA